MAPQYLNKLMDTIPMETTVCAAWLGHPPTGQGTLWTQKGVLWDTPNSFIKLNFTPAPTPRAA